MKKTFYLVNDDQNNTIFYANYNKKVHDFIIDMGLDILPFIISGNTYQAKKDSLRDLAINFQTFDRGGLFWSDYLAINNFFEYYGRRYGLLTELKENCII